MTIRREFALGSWSCPCGATVRENLRSAIPVSWLAICVACETICEIMPLPIEDEGGPDAA